MKPRNHLRKVLRIALICGALVTIGVLALNEWIVRSTHEFIFTDKTALPQSDVALVLGTGKLLRGSGNINPHFRKRIEAAAELYHAGKVKHLLLSGDNHIAGYDEPTDMAEALMALNVPPSAMTLDYAGFRTFDSVVRAKKVFGQSQVTIVTDDFHVARSVFLARHEGMDAVAFCSAKVSTRFSARSRVREVGARVKAALDVYVLNTQPRFLGEPVQIQLVSAD
jgi:SanA protein